MKFETVGIHFLSDVFSLVVILKFCYYGNDDVSLYSSKDLSFFRYAKQKVSHRRQ